GRPRRPRQARPADTPPPPPASANPPTGPPMRQAPGAYAEPEAPPPASVYAAGRIEPRFCTLSAEKEFAQATGRAETAGLSDRRALQAVLSQRENRYLARQLGWGLTIEGLETYILQPHDPADLHLLVAALP